MIHGLALLLAVAAPVPAATSSMRNHDSRAPVDVEADRIEVQDRADRAIFAGNVKARQGDLNLTAQRVTVAYTNTAGAGAQVQRLDASGNVVVQSPTETATGKFAIYDLDRRLITMLGGVTLVRQGNRASGGRLVLDLNSGRATLDGSAVGGGGVTGRGGRVTGRFTVASQSQPGK